MDNMESWALDADGATLGSARDNGHQPVDLVAHDAKYHPHGYNGGKCKYREVRAAALSAKTDAESDQDIIDRLTPESVSGEEVDNADMLEQTAATKVTGKSEGADIPKLESAIPKFRGIARSLLNAVLDRKKAESVQPLLDEMSRHIEWVADNAQDADKKFGDRFASTLGKLAALLKNGALNEMLGLEPAGASSVSTARQTIPPVSAERRKELEGMRAKKAADADMIKRNMNLASPRLAARLQQSLLSLEDEIAGIDAELAGKPRSKSSKSKKDVARERKEAEKKAKKKAVASSKLGQSGAAQGVVLDSAKSVDDLQSGKTSVLGSTEFKAILASLPREGKIFALSDLHDAGLKGVDPSDFGTMICAGDFTKHGATSHSKGIGLGQAIQDGTKWLNDKFFKFCDKNKNTDFIVIAGNHDHFLGDPSADSIQWPSNVCYLKDSEAVIRGMHVYGTPWCEKRKGSAKTASMSSSVAVQPFELDDAAIKEKFDMIPSGIDILVVHQPPRFDMKDEKGNDIGLDVAWVGGKMQHCGSQALTDAILRAKPKLVICGHLHDGDHRPYKIGDSVVINGSYVANRGDPSWTAHEIGVLKEPEGATSDNSVGFFVDGEDNHQITKNG